MLHFIKEMSKAERKAYRNVLRDKIIDAGGRLYVDEYNGTVLAIKPNIFGNNCKTFSVAVAYCNPHDKFKKSIGEILALYRLNANMCINVRCENLSNTSLRMDEIASNLPLSID